MAFPPNLPYTLPEENTDAWRTLNSEVMACFACPRLVEWREQVAREKRRAYYDWDYWGKPVPGFGDPKARLFIVGLAPGAHGSNRTGQMFTGDSSGLTLFATMYRAGFASQPNALTREDGLRLRDAFITAIGRCAPPKNKPTRAELNACQPFLHREWELMPQVQIVLALGKMAFDDMLRLWRTDGFAVPRLKFGHGVQYPINLDSRRVILMASYHPSRQNTQTGRLTQQMFDDIFFAARDLLAAG